MNNDWRRQHYSGRHVLVTGGLGFIGSNLAIALHEAGAGVQVIDSCVEGCGANPHNLDAAPDIVVHRVDIGDRKSVREIVRGVDLVFNLAGEISHIDSMRRPSRDLELNAVSQLHFLETCVAEFQTKHRVVFASTRQVYGAPQCLPVDENHPIEPVDYNGVHKVAAEQYHRLQSRLQKVDTVILRLTNVYGPRQALHLPGQGVLGVFLRSALEGRRLQVFGDGYQLRDPLHVSDAVDAFLMAGIRETRERIFNIGSGMPCTLYEIASTISEIAGLEGPLLRPFPDEKKKIDIGDYYSCIERANHHLRWFPQTSLREGLRQTFQYYASRRAQYGLEDDPRSITLEKRATASGGNEYAG
jgi:UDP-glucose 4-epimerase